MGKKRILSFILCAVTAVSLVACSGQKQTASDSNKKDYVYIPEYITLSDDENRNYNNLSLKNNTLYYTQYGYDESTMTYNEMFCKHSLEDGSVEQIPLSLSENSNIDGCTVDANGNIYALYSDYSAGRTSPEGYLLSDVFLCKYDAKGTLLVEKDITAEVYKDSENVYINGMTVDAEGNTYVSMEDSVLLLNAEGEAQGRVSIGEGWINGLGAGKDGKVYICYYDYASATGGMALSEIDFAGKKIGATYSNVPNMNGGGLSAGADGGFLMQDGSKVYKYDLESQTYEEILSWLECDIDGTRVSYMGAMEDGTIVAMMNDWETGVTELAKLNQKAASEVVQKEEIVIATLYNDQQLQTAAVAFNKANDKYRVVLKTYMDQNNWEEDSYTTAMTNLQNDIVSASNCPDIIDLAELENEKALAAKGAFEDLTPYLEQSSVLSKEDFLETVLEGFSYEGKLLSIPTSFSIETIVGKSSVVGEEMGWSMDDMMACFEKYPEAELMEGYQKSTALYLTLLFGENNYINWEKSECYFNTDEFKKVLEFANLFPYEYDWNSYDDSGRVEKFQNNEVLLESASIYDLQEIQVYEARYGEPVTFVGYPTADGSVGCTMSANARYGIISKSDNKDGAWAFIESYLTSSDDSVYFWGIPTLKDQFEEMITKATTPEYILDENGEPLLDEDGNPMEMGTSSMSSGGWEYTYHTPTPEEAQVLRDLIAVAKPMGAMDTNLLTIIIEEVEPYFAGEKSIDEVVNIVQSRAQIYISENS